MEWAHHFRNCLWIQITYTDYMDYSLIISLSVSVIHKFDYVFSENGLVAYKAGALIGQQVSIVEYKCLCSKLI